MNDLKSVRRALLSVTDKSGLVDFAKTLASLGVELVSTGGTSKALRDAGLTVRDISDLTGFPEMLDGRVKTLHPKVHGGILHMRHNPEHMAAVAEHAIEPIDMVVVNLYAFEKTASKPNAAFSDIIENIDLAASKKDQPIFVWSGGKARLIGRQPSQGVRDALEFALARDEVRSVDYAEAREDISVSNASMKFKALWIEGFILRRESTAESGGLEHVYSRIA